MLGEIKAAGKDDKQKLLNKPICSFDEFKILIFSVFGFNIVKIFETEEQDIDEPPKHNDGPYLDY